MLRFSLFVLLLVCLSGKMSSAQPPDWLWATGATAFGSAISSDASGCIYVTGRFNADSIVLGNITLHKSAIIHVYVAKYDPMGNVVWAIKSEGSTTIDWVTGIANASNGDVLLTGNFNSDTIRFGNLWLADTSVAINLYIVRLDSSGNVLWAKNHLGSSNAVTADDAGNAYITGSTDSSDFLLQKYDPAGNLIMTRTTTGPGTVSSRSVSLDASGNIFVTGGFNGTVMFDTVSLTSAAIPYTFVVRYDPAGNVAWAKSCGGNVWNIAADPIGNSFITGSFQYTITIGANTLVSAGMEDIYTARFDQAGNVSWVIPVGGPDGDGGANLVTDDDGEVYVTGSFMSASVNFGSVTLTNVDPSGNSSEMFLVKYDSTGAILWADAPTGPGDDYTGDVTLLGPDHCAVGGMTYSGAITFGNITWNTPGTGCMFVAKQDFTTAIVSPDGRQSFQIYPNPNNGSFTIAGQPCTEVSIYDLAGKKVYGVRNDMQTFNCTLAPGIYLLKAFTEKGPVIQRFAVAGKD